MIAVMQMHCHVYLMTTQEYHSTLDELRSERVKHLSAYNELVYKLRKLADKTPCLFGEFANINHVTEALGWVCSLDCSREMLSVLSKAQSCMYQEAALIHWWENSKIGEPPRVFIP